MKWSDSYLMYTKFFCMHIARLKNKMEIHKIIITKKETLSKLGCHESSSTKLGKNTHRRLHCGKSADGCLVPKTADLQTKVQTMGNGVKYSRLGV